MKIFLKILYAFEFAGFYLAKLVEANLYIAWDILTPRMRSTPGMIEFPLSIKSELGMLLFSNLVSMTPGTLSVDIYEDKSYCLIHILYLTDEEKVFQELTGIEKKIKRMAN